MAQSTFGWILDLGRIVLDRVGTYQPGPDTPRRQWRQGGPCFGPETPRRQWRPGGPCFGPDTPRRPWRQGGPCFGPDTPRRPWRQGGPGALQYKSLQMVPRIIREVPLCPRGLRRLGKSMRGKLAG